MDPTTLFDRLWDDYLRHAPSAGGIHALLGGGAPIVNDHIALRTFATERLGVDALHPLFETLGYSIGDHYRFRAKKLRARYYRHRDPALPKIFISELLLDECSDTLRDTVLSLCEQVPAGAAGDPAFLAGGRPWDLPWASYAALREESEYAAWLAAHGYRANHFTVSVNDLPGFASVAAVNRALKAAGYALNDAGGEIKGSPAVLLEQSSTIADRVPVSFSDGEQLIPGCFYEFAFRYPQADGSLYQGFVEASADRIFESTDERP
ncbi:MAG TPA: DUF1338 domain-containing protein [Pseudohaliea sp.]|nr:DUF1338 domain-containing protein [Pseudohaliea sp.]